MSFCIGVQMSLLEFSDAKVFKTTGDAAHGMLENILREGMRYYDSETVGERHAPVLDAQLHGPSYNGCDDLHAGLRKVLRGNILGRRPHLTPKHRTRRNLHVMPKLEVRGEDHR